MSNCIKINPVTNGQHRPIGQWPQKWLELKDEQRGTKTTNERAPSSVGGGGVPASSWMTNSSQKQEIKSDCWNPVENNTITHSIYTFLFQSKKVFYFMTNAIKLKASHDIEIQSAATNQDGSIHRGFHRWKQQHKRQCSMIVKKTRSSACAMLDIKEDPGGRGVTFHFLPRRTTRLHMCEFFFIPFWCN